MPDPWTYERLPLAPFLDLLPPGSLYAKARALPGDFDSNRQRLIRARRTGCALVTAELLADQIGAHPSAIWGDAYEQVIEARRARRHAADVRRRSARR